MCGQVAKKLNPDKFRLYECGYPASIGPASGNRGVSLDTSVRQAVNDLAWFTAKSPNPVGIISYSLGGIAAMRFLEEIQSGKHRNADGSPLEVTFSMNIANPARNAGDSALGLGQGSGIHGGHGKLPAGTVNIELANGRDMITSCDRFSPVRRVSDGLSPFSWAEGARLGDIDAQLAIRNLQRDDWLSFINPARYPRAVEQLAGYLGSWGTPPRSQHTLYWCETMPGTNRTWTDWAADEINGRWGR
jgi:hypothetical protein